MNEQENNESDTVQVETATDTEESTELEDEEKRETLQKMLASGTALTLGGYGTFGNHDYSMVGEAEANPLVVLGVAGVLTGGLYGARQSETIKDGISTLFNIDTGATYTQFKENSYLKASSIAAEFEDDLAGLRSRVQANKGNLYSEAKLAAAKGLKNGKTQSEIVNDASAAVDETAAIMFKSAYKDYNRIMSSVIDLANKEDQIRDVSTGEYLRDFSGTFYVVTPNLENVPRKEVTLPDGSKYKILDPKVENNTNSGYDDNPVSQLNDTGNYWDFSGGNDPYRLSFPNPNGSERARFFNGSKFDAVLEEIENIRTTVKNNVTTVIDDLVTWSEQEGNEITDEVINDFINSTDRVRTSAESWTESGSRTYASDVFNEIGLEQSDPQYNVSVETQVNGSTQTLKGTLMADYTNDISSFKVGTTYDPSNYTGDVWFYEVIDSETYLLENQWTITNLKNPQGDSIKSESYMASSGGKFMSNNLYVNPDGSYDLTEFNIINDGGTDDNLSQATSTPAPIKTIEIQFNGGVEFLSGLDGGTFNIADGMGGTLGNTMSLDSANNKLTITFTNTVSQDVIVNLVAIENNINLTPGDASYTFTVKDDTGAILGDETANFTVGGDINPSVPSQQNTFASDSTTDLIKQIEDLQAQRDTLDSQKSGGGGGSGGLGSFNPIVWIIGILGLGYLVRGVPGE